MVADALCYSGDRKHLNYQIALLEEQGHELSLAPVDALKPEMSVMLSLPDVEGGVKRRFHVLLLEQCDALGYIACWMVGLSVFLKLLQ